MKQHISEIACVVSAFAALGCIPTAFAHTTAYMYGFFIGKYDGRNGLYDNGAACDMNQMNAGYGNGVVIQKDYWVNLTYGDNQQRCESGYTHGWTATCKEALTNPAADKDIYGCPGVSTNKITQVLENK